MEISRRELVASLAVGLAAPARVQSAAANKSSNSYPGPKSIGHRKIISNGISIHIAEQGQGPLVILCHGFPESWYSWRHQIPALAEAGYHVVAPDTRGYGDTEAPADQNAYSIMDLVGDMVGLVTALGQQSAIIVGHDWGATIAWHSALPRPDVFNAVAAMSVPFRQRQSDPPLRLLRRSGLYTYYWLYYQDPGVADAEYDKDPKDTLLRTLYTFSGDAPHSDVNRRILEPGKGALDSTIRPDHLPSWLLEEDLNYMAQQLAKNGFRNPLNYYRNIDNNWKQLAPWAGGTIRQPALFIAGSEDHVIRGPTGKSQLDAQTTTVPGLRKQLIMDGVGHYVQQERPPQVTAALKEFLKDVSS